MSPPLRSLVSLSLLIGMGLLAVPAAGPVQAYPDRVVQAVLAVDGAFRESSDWEERARGAVSEASGRMSDDFGIRINVLRLEPWRSSARANDLAALHDDLVKTFPADDADIVIGFAGGPSDAEFHHLQRLGHSDTPGRYIVVSGQSGPDLPLVLRHELGHAFGAPHISKVPSLMSEELRPGWTRFDDASAAIIRNNARLDFRSEDPFAGCRLEPLRALYDRLAGEGSQVADLVSIVGDSHRRRGALDPARAAYRRALDLDPEIVGPRLGLGLVAMARKQWSEAVSCLEAARRQDPELDGLDRNLGLAYSEQGLNSSAIFAYQNALARDPGDVDVMNNLGLLYSQTSRPEEAIRTFEAALEIRENAILHRNLAVVLLEQGRRIEAREHIEASLRLEPEQADAAHLKELARRLQ